MAADNLYSIHLDNWLRAYFTTYFLSVTILLGAAVFGGYRLRQGSNSGAVVPLMTIALIGSIACMGHLVDILTGHNHSAPQLALLGGYLATTATALACGIYWQRRVADLTRPWPQH